MNLLSVPHSKNFIISLLLIRNMKMPGNTVKCWRNEMMGIVVLSDWIIAVWWDMHQKVIRKVCVWKRYLKRDCVGNYLLEFEIQDDKYKDLSTYWHLLKVYQVFINKTGIWFDLFWEKMEEKGEMEEKQNGNKNWN